MKKMRMAVVFLVMILVTGCGAKEAQTEAEKRQEYEEIAEILYEKLQKEYFEALLVTNERGEKLPKPEEQEEQIQEKENVPQKIKYEETAEPKWTKESFEYVKSFPDFEVIFYPDENEVVCVKDSKEIGPRTVIDPVDLEIEKIGYNSLINKAGTLVVPVIQKNSEGTTFQIVHLTDIDDVNTFRDVSDSWNYHYAEITGHRYDVLNNVVTYVENATQLGEEEMFLIVEGEEIVIQKYEIDYHDFFKYAVCDSVEKRSVFIAGKNPETGMVVLIQDGSLVYSVVSDAIEEEKFSEYAVSHYEYLFPSFTELEQFLSEIGTSMDEIIVHVNQAD